MKEIAPADRPAFGQLNEVRNAITAAVDARVDGLLAAKDSQAARGIDPTLPARSLHRGTLHPLSQVLDRAVDTLGRMGFAIAEGPEIETEWHLRCPEYAPGSPGSEESDTAIISPAEISCAPTPPACKSARWRAFPHCQCASSPPERLSGGMRSTKRIRSRSPSWKVFTSIVKSASRISREPWKRSSRRSSAPEQRSASALTFSRSRNRVLKST